jgi:hypothetical protein
MAKKQNIYIPSDDRAAHNRIEKAIPIFERKFGMSEEQATAVAIRLESIGQLKLDGTPAPRPKDVPRGQPIPPAFIGEISRRMMKQREPSRTVYREGEEFIVSSAFDARRKIERTKRKPKGLK